MRQLAPNDAFMLYAEAPGSPNQIASLGIFDPSTTSGWRRLSDVDGLFRVPDPPGQGVPATPGQGAPGSRRPMVGGGRQLRPGIPRAAHGAAPARRLEPALHARGPTPLPPARSHPPAVGGLPHRGTRRRPRRPARVHRHPGAGASHGHRRRRRHRVVERLVPAESGRSSARCGRYVATGGSAELVGPPRPRRPFSGRSPGAGGSRRPPGGSAGRPRLRAIAQTRDSASGPDRALHPVQCPGVAPPRVRRRDRPP